MRRYQWMIDVTCFYRKATEAMKFHSHAHDLDKVGFVSSTIFYISLFIN